MSDQSIVRHLEQQASTADILRRAKAVVWSLRHGLPCINSAINRASSNGWNKAHWAMCEALGDKSRPELMWKFNDAPRRTHAEIMAAFDRAIAIAERGER